MLYLRLLVITIKHCLLNAFLVFASARNAMWMNQRHPMKSAFTVNMATLCWVREGCKDSMDSSIRV